MDRNINPQSLHLELYSERESLFSVLEQCPSFLNVNLCKFDSSHYEPGLNKVILIDQSHPEAINDETLERLLHHLKGSNLSPRIGFLTSMGKESRARELLKKRLIDFYIPIPCHSSLIYSEILLSLASKASPSVFLDELLTQALDERRSGLAERIAQFRRTIQTKE